MTPFEFRKHARRLRKAGAAFVRYSCGELRMEVAFTEPEAPEEKQPAVGSGISIGFGSDEECEEDRVRKLRAARGDSEAGE